jgi:hypothetical protein
LFFSSCGTQKRYSKGFKYSHVAFQKTDKKVVEDTDDIKLSNNIENIGIIPSKNIEKIQKEQSQDFATLNSDFTSFKNHTPKENLISVLPYSQNNPPDSCDEIIMRNGEIITGKVIELSRVEIKYKRCRNLDGPNIVVNINDVLLIRYSNGDTDNFATRKTTEPAEEINEELEQRVKAQSDASLILGLISGSAVLAGLIWLMQDEFISMILGFSAFPLALLATVFGGMALKWKVKKQSPNNRNGKARAGLLLGIIGLAGVLATAISVVLLA